IVKLPPLALAPAAWSGGDMRDIDLPGAREPIGVWIEHAWSDLRMSVSGVLRSCRPTPGTRAVEQSFFDPEDVLHAAVLALLQHRDLGWKGMSFTEAARLLAHGIKLQQRDLHRRELVRRRAWSVIRGHVRSRRTEQRGNGATGQRSNGATER
ncbi:MAG: hypothetical protein KDC87_08055, partial [Planctomycetes bacterium]|nr:hypothetical protein [Planctomycetota bacterium]